MSHNPRALLDQFGVQPKKSLGQHFMHDPGALQKIVAAADIGAQDTVVEVGAGTGALTEALAARAGQVYAIELDSRLQPILEERFDDADNVYLVFADILKLDIAALVPTGEYVVVANAPYYISSAIIWHFIESSLPPLRLVLTMQYEVAERIVGGSGAQNLLSIAAQFYGRARIIGKLGPAVFVPRPHIDSAIVRIDTHETPSADVPGAEAFFRVLRAGFSQKRKQLKNSLAGGLGMRARTAGGLLQEAGIDPKRRAETLSLEEWARLTRTIPPPSVPPSGGGDETTPRANM